MDHQTVLKRDLKHVETPAVVLAGARLNSTHSEASSYNSRIAPLPINLQRNGSQAKQKKGINGRRTFLGFGCRKPCSDKKSVHIGPNPTRPENLKFENNLEEPRYSIELFGSGVERKLNMVTWDAIPKAQNTGDDMASDTSSDLFEIENISVAAHPVMLADDASICISPTSHCEASIQWSAVDYSAAASGYYDDMSVSVAGNRIHKSNKEVKKGWQWHGGIWGCTSRKAVDVA